MADTKAAQPQPSIPGVSDQPQPQPQPQQQQPPARPKVKSYLHKFYDRSSSVKDPALYEPGGAEDADELRRLLNSGRRAKSSGCHLRPVVWKAMLWIGVNCLIFGALGLAIAFFLPHEPELVEVRGAQGFVRSRANADWNRSASILKYVALGIFGAGALVTAAGLVLPSLVWRLFDEDENQAGTDSCCSSGGSATKKRRQRPPLAGTTSSTVTTSVAGTVPATLSTTTAAATTTGAAATTGEAPTLSSLVDERPVQPARGPEGHVSHGQVK